MSRMDWRRPRHHRPLRPLDVPRKIPCWRCHQTIVLLRFGQSWFPYEPDGWTRHRCPTFSKMARIRNASRRRGHSPKPPKVKRPAPLPKGRGDVGTQQHLEPVTPVEAVYRKLRRYGKPGVFYTIPYEMGVRRLLELTEPVLVEAALSDAARETAQNCVREWCRRYCNLYGRPLAAGLASTFGRYRNKGVDKKVLEEMLLAIDKALGPPL